MDGFDVQNDRDEIDKWVALNRTRSLNYKYIERQYTEGDHSTVSSSNSTTTKLAFAETVFASLRPSVFALNPLAPKPRCITGL
jgi:hypothetical protein